MRNDQPQGFTLLEVLISLSIITIGALSVFALMNRTVTTTEVNRNSIIAVNLAREGVEIVRSIRDSDSLGFAELDNNSPLVCPAYPDCSFIVDSNTYYNLTSPADSLNIFNCTNCHLYITNGQYSHVNTGTLTGMKRMVHIAEGNSVACASAASCEKVVTVEVLQPGSSQPYTLITHLTNWR